MKSEEPTVHEFAPDDPRIAAFHAVREKVGYPTPDEPVPADMRCLVAFRGGVPVARLSYGTAWHIRGVAGPCMLIGHYERTDRWAGAWLLDEVLARTPDGHLFHALGPINGSTWGRYRLALPPRLEEEGDPEPPFLSEPWNPPDYPADFEERGFRVIASYESAIVEDLATPDPRSAELAERVSARGATIRPLDLDRFDDELRAIFELSRTAFAENLFYSPIEFDEFRARYLPLRPLLDPDMVRLAEDADGRLLGFVFAFPDLLSASGGPPTRVVLKTLASAPEARGLGLGTFLTDEVRRVAHEKGYRSVIHALMQADNESVRISRHSARVFRRYALYEVED